MRTAAYLQDRHVLGVLVVRLASLAALLFLPDPLSIPGTFEPVRAFILWPAVNGLLYAMTLPETLHWLYKQAPARHRLLKLAVILIELPILLLTAWGALTTESDGLLFIPAMTTLVIATALLTATQWPGAAWLPALVVGLAAITIPWSLAPLTWAPAVYTVAGVLFLAAAALHTHYSRRA